MCVSIHLRCALCIHVHVYVESAGMSARVEPNQKDLLAVSLRDTAGRGGSWGLGAPPPPPHSNRSAFCPGLSFYNTSHLRTRILLWNPAGVLGSWSARSLWPLLEPAPTSPPPLPTPTWPHRESREFLGSGAIRSLAKPRGGSRWWQIPAWSPLPPPLPNPPPPAKPQA